MLTDMVYSDLKEKILSLTLKPGTPLSFTHLKPAYNVSISPIRDALKRLENEGLIEIKPQSGTKVSKIDFAKVRDERFRRISLELGAIVKAFEMGTIGTIVPAWEESIANQEKAVQDKDISLFIKLDDQMHRLLFEACNHEKVFDDMLDRSGNNHRLRVVSFLFNNNLDMALNQHKEILEAIKSNDQYKVYELEKKHINTLESQTSDYTKSYPQYFKA